MKANRSRNTSPEILLRSALHRRGLRFRIHRRAEPDLRTTPDVVFGPTKTAVFVDGCFWHSCPSHGTIPKSNGRWWKEKLEANVERDRRADAALRARGWHVIRVWEHEPPEDAAARIAQVVRNFVAQPTLAATAKVDHQRSAQ